MALRRERIEADARRQHQALLRAADGDVHAPFVVPVIGAGQARDAVDHQQRRMAGGVDGLAHRRDVAGHAGGGLVVHDAHRLDRVLACRPCSRASIMLGLHAAAPALDARQRPGIRSSGPAASPSCSRALAKWPVSYISTASPGLSDVGQRRLPGAGARCRIDDDRMPGLEDLRDALEHPQAERAELRAAVVDRRQAHRPQDAVGHRGRPGDLQEVAAGRDGSRASASRGLLRRCCAMIFACKIQHVNRATPDKPFALQPCFCIQNSRHDCRHHFHSARRPARAGGAAPAPDAGGRPHRARAPSSTSASWREVLQVSRTPLREAIKMLAAEGLVELLPNRGAIAVSLSEADVRNTFEVMAGLEAHVGRTRGAAHHRRRNWPRSGPCSSR